tara:strand:- start:330 stop:674 length:345 start_codon:yes stop_codon:yes gene_type:complete
MKSIIFVLLLAWSLGYGQSAFSDCFYPKMKVDIPNGSTATMEEMAETQTDFRAYNADMDVYLDCLDDELSKISEDFEGYKDIKRISDDKYNAAIDQLTKAAEEWNQAVRSYKAQ